MNARAGAVPTKLEDEGRRYWKIMDRQWRLKVPVDSITSHIPATDLKEHAMHPRLNPDRLAF